MRITPLTKNTTIRTVTNTYNMTITPLWYFLSVVLLSYYVCL
jgi:hypothetical protein